MAKYGGGFGGGMNMQAMMQQAKSCRNKWRQPKPNSKIPSLQERRAAVSSRLPLTAKKASASFDKTGSGRHGRSGDARGSYYGSV